MKKRWAVPETLGCLQRCDPYLIATSGRRVALFIPPHRSDCMLWLLQSGSAQFWGSACLFGHSPVCSLSRANWRNPRQNCHCQSCYYHRASSVLDNDNKTHTANAHSALENKTGHTSVRVKNWLGLAYYLKKKKKILDLNQIHLGHCFKKTDSSHFHPSLCCYDFSNMVQLSQRWMDEETVRKFAVRCSSEGGGVQMPLRRKLFFSEPHLVQRLPPLWWCHGCCQQ